MASLDPRLADPTVLVLAAKRCQAARLLPDWRQSEGLASLLAAAKSLPKRDPWDLPDVEASSGLGQLLVEARRVAGAAAPPVREEEAHGVWP